MAEVVDRGDTLDLPETVVPEVEVPETPKVETSGVETPEAKEPEAKAEPRERDDTGKFIPKGRFDEAVSKERTRAEVAERKFAELQATLKQVDRTADTQKLEAEITTLEKQQAKFLLDGDSDKAAELAGQIRLKERTIAIQETSHLSAVTKNEMREEIRYDTAVEGLEATYDVLNPSHESFDPELVDFVLSTQSSLISSERLTPSAALVKAAEKVMNKLGPRTAEGEPAKGLAAGKVASDRKQAQVEKNIAAAKAQPASMKQSGMDSDKVGITGNVDVSKLTREEFAALPAATKAKLRGDLME